MAGILNQPMSGFLQGRNQALAENQANLQNQMGILQQAALMDSIQNNREMKPLQMQQLQAQIIEAQRKSAAAEQFRSILSGASQGSPIGQVQRDASGNIQEGGMSVPGQRPASNLPALLADPAFAITAKNAGIDLTEFFKFYNTQQNLKPGIVKDPITGQERHIPNLDPGQTLNPQGVVSNAPGFLGALSERKAVEGNFDVVQVPQSDGTTITIPRSQIQSVLSGRPAPQPPAPVPPVSAPVTSPTDWRAGRPQAEIDAVTKLQEAERNGQPMSITMPREPSGIGSIPTNRIVGVSQSPAVAEASKVTAKNDAELVSGYRQKILPLTNTLRRLDRMEELSKNDQTFMAAGAELKSNLSSIAQALGLPVERSRTANTEEYIAHVAELLKDRLASKDYGSGTGVSNVDLLAAGRPLPDVMRTAQGRAQIIQALRKDAELAIQDMTSARDFFEKNMSLNGFRYPSEINAQIRKTTPKPAVGGGVINFGDLK